MNLHSGDFLSGTLSRDKDVLAVVLGQSAHGCLSEDDLLGVNLVVESRVQRSEVERATLTVTPSTADSCLAFSDSSMHVFDTNTTGIFSWISF